MLTVEQLKKLEIGDWIWIQDESFKNGTYRQVYIQDPAHPNLFYLSSYTNPCKLFDFAEYDKTWRAWKNKEQCENKEDVVWLPRKKDHDVVFIDDSEGELNARIVTGYLVHHYEIGVHGIDLAVFYNLYTNEQHSEAICHYGKRWFATEEEAQKRLAELKGEN